MDTLYDTNSAADCNQGRRALQDLTLNAPSDVQECLFDTAIIISNLKGYNVFHLSAICLHVLKVSQVIKSHEYGSASFRIILRRS